MNKQITININENQERFLKEFAIKQACGSPANLGTAYPLHVVETTDYTYVRGVCDGGEPCYQWQGEIYTNAMDIIAQCSDFELDKASELMKTTDIENVFAMFDLDADVYTRISHYRPVAFFFVRDRAKEYVKYQAHNLCEPRIFTYAGGYSNDGEFKSFYDMLMHIGNKLNNTED